MLIELHRKVVATDYWGCCCAICGNDFDRGSVFPVARADHGDLLGEMCPMCLEYLNRRKHDARDTRVLANWPARDWPTLADLEAARRRYPEPMFATKDDLFAAIPDQATDEKVHAAAVVWRMEPERVS